MKTISITTLLFYVLCNLCSAQDLKEKIIVAYVTSGSSVMPDAKSVTHINYAFGRVNASFNGINIDKPERLIAIAALKNQNENLKILLSVGGWSSGGFSEMASLKKNRNKFARSCAAVLKKYKLDGIDMDWEYPTSDIAGINASPFDTENYTLLMKKIRKKIGHKRLLTLASVDNAKYVDFKALHDVIDFVNIMLYETDFPPKHHASLYRSALTSYISGEESVAVHLKAGLKPKQIVLGLPFYGTGNGKEVPKIILYKDIPTLTELETRWDDTAKASYMVDKGGVFVCSYESPESIRYKCEFVKSKNLRGIMYWHYAADTDDGILRKAVYNNLMGKE